MNFEEITKVWGDNYDYESAVFNDLKEYALEWLNDHYEEEIELKDFSYSLYDDAFVSDSVTGNASGSYWCNSWKSEICLVGNSELYSEALAEFGGTFDESPENRDVTIRCYMLGRVIDDVLQDEDIQNKFEELKDKEA
jgi:hypothetical protein